MSLKHSFAVRLKDSLLFFAIWDILPGETLDNAIERIEFSRPVFASAGHLDVVLGMLRNRRLKLKGWRTLFGVGEKCRMPLGNGALEGVCGLDVRGKSIWIYRGSCVPTRQSGVLVFVAERPATKV